MGANVATDRRRVGVRVRGVVQGVGFRPAVYRLARELRLGGFVRNEVDSVCVEVEGSPDAVGRFLAELPRASPPAARLDSVQSRLLPPSGESDFHIAGSREDVVGRAVAAAIPVDQAPCQACLRELTDRTDRRHRHPFINCTDCGPRFTIVRRVPYDRPCTTMASFELCDACRREYGDPSDRRFHAEPNACPECGPRLSFVVPGEEAVFGEAALKAAAKVLAQGAIVAVKGAGGFALATDARSEHAVRRLRVRKRRPDKPFAVMARDLAEAETVAELDAVARRTLVSAARPIVLVPKREGDAEVAEAVAPNLTEVGIFLPPTPLQYLLAWDGPALQVMTSGNRSAEPIAKDDAEAVRRLTGIADAFLLHDRAIHSRADDSVVRVIAGAPVPLRRARGYVPESIRLRVSGPPVLAVGGEGKGAVCLVDGGTAILSQHLGELDHPDALAFFEEAIDHLGRLVGIEPEVVACDPHPEYRTSRWARASDLRVVAVQHHHAHVASCLAEHGRPGPVIGVAFDGTGYGPDGTSWGGEILFANLGGYRRLGHLRPVALAGGEAAIREPWRIALAALVDAGESTDVLSGVGMRRIHKVRQLLDRRIATSQATGAGRWFDAVAALAGVCPTASYEGQAAVELEAVAGIRREPAYPFELDARTPGPFRMDLRPMVRRIAADVRAGAPASVIAARFQETMAEVVAACCRRARADGAPPVVVLTGGCFQNRRLTERSKELLEQDGFEVLLHARVPPNDGGLALGQAAVASFRLASTGERA